MKASQLSKNIVLIGMMGSGKSRVSQSLSRKLKIKVFSTDDIIEKAQKLSVNQIVEQKGWSYFRQLEHKLTLQLSKKKGIIIDCGGGIVINPKNLKLLKKNGTIFYLKTSPRIIYQRLKKDKTRPLMQGPKPLARLRSIYQERLPLYSQADYTVDASDDSIQKPVAEILKKISK